MKKLLILLISGFTLLPSPSPGAQTAQARLVCASLRFQRGSALDTTGIRWTMDFTSTPPGINGELAPNFFLSPAGYSNSTYLELEEELFGDNFSGMMVLDTPAL